MSPAELLAYLGPALIYAGCATTLFVVLMYSVVSGPLRLRGPQTLTLFFSFFFLILTQFPFPDRATLDCSSGGVTPILTPFATFDHVTRLWLYTQKHVDAGLSVWVGSKVIQAAIMNFVLCAVIGAAFARHTERRPPWLWAVGLGILLSGSAELAQLTGFFGLYPCAWRTFEVDDLIFNTAGLIAGFVLIKKLKTGQTQH